MNLDKKIYSLIAEEKTNGQIGLMIPTLSLNKIKEVRKQFELDHEIKRSDILPSVFLDGSISKMDLLAADYIRCGWWIYNEYNDDFKFDLSSNNPRIIKDNYEKWVDECIKKCFKIGPILNVIIKNIKTSKTDEQFKYRHGTTKRNIIAGLRLYNNMFEIKKPLKNDTYTT